MTQCLACLVNSGEQSPPGGVIWNDGLWQVDHRVHPCPTLGWLIVKPIRHVEFFDDLTPEEASRFGSLLKRVTAALRACLPESPVKVYTILFAESADCPHIHFHVVPRMKDHPVEFRGPHVFGLSGDIATDEIEQLAQRLRSELSGSPA
ncbi:HIT family protein [Alicyclobacillus curvatus]|nr:HIT family protein [Alicyclobacillus curvatus]